MKNILVATDGSKQADKAVDAAAELAVSLGAKLTIVNVQDTKPLGEMQSNFVEREFADQLGTHGSGVPAETLSMYQGLGLRAAIEAFDNQSSMLRQALSDNVLAHARNLATKKGATSIAVVSATGDAANEIVAAAKQVGADLIVMGRRGLSGLSELILGSVSQEVLHKAPANVLTVA